MKLEKKHQIIFVGDVFLKTKSNSITPFNSEIAGLFQGASCVIANLETVLADKGQSQQKAICLQVEPKKVEYLREVGIDVVNLANNHIFDYGVDGFRSTLTALDASSIKYIGTLQHGEQYPYILQIEGYNIGFLGYTIGNSFLFNYEIGSFNEQKIIKDITKLKSNNNIEHVMVNIHWGEEYVPFPSPNQQRIARRLIDYGADVIIGHHPHIVQGVEAYKNGVIFYSLGNFNFMNSCNFNKNLCSNQWGLIAIINFFPDSSIKYEYIPIQIDDEYCPHLASGAEADSFLMYIEDISARIKPQINGLFWIREASWPHFCNNVPAFFQRIKQYGLFHLLLMVRWLISPSNYSYYLGLFLFLLTRLFGYRLTKPIRSRATSKDKQYLFHGE